jgi:hypothetical protein
MGRKRSAETKRKISEGIKKARLAKKAAAERQAEADLIMNNFEAGSGKAPKRLSRFSEFQEYVRVNPEAAKKEKHGLEGVYHRLNEDRKRQEAINGKVSTK